MYPPDVISGITQSDMVCLNCTPSGLIRFVSDNIQKLIPFYSAAELSGKNIFDVLFDDDHPQVQQACKELEKKGDSSCFTMAIRTPDRNRVHIRVNMYYVHEIGFFCVLMPVKDSTFYNENSFRQVEVMRTTLESMDDFVFVLDKDGLFSEFYSSGVPASQQAGIASTFQVGSKLSDAGFPESVSELFYSHIQKVKKTRKPEPFNYSIKAFGGELFYQARISPRYTLQNQFDGVTVVIRDISTLVKSEKKLKQSLDYYLRVMDHFPNLIWRCNTMKKMDYFNHTWTSFTGGNVKEDHGEGWQQKIHALDRARVLEEFNKKFVHQKPFTLEYRLKHYAGHYRWIKNFCQPLFDFKERFSGYIGSCFDIDDIRTTQHLLQASESRYRTMVQGQSDLVIRWKENFHLTFVNNSFCDFFAKSPAYLLGVKWTSLVEEADQPQITANLKNVVKNKKDEFFEMDLKNHKGKLYTYQWLNSPIYDEKGNIIEYQSVGRDVTEKIQKEKENENLLTQLNERVKELSFLNNFSRFSNETIKAGKLLSKLVNTIAKSFHSPDTTYAYIAYEGEAYQSKGYDQCPKNRGLKYHFGSQNNGVLKIYCAEKPHQKKQVSCFLDSEKDMLKTLCEMLTNFFRKQEAEQKLVQSELRYRELFDNVVDIVFSIDTEGVILKINAAAQRILGTDSLEGRNFWELLAPSERVEITRKFRQIIEDRQESFFAEISAVSKTGDIKYLQLNGFVKYNDLHETASEVFGIARDITEKRKHDKKIMKTIINTEERERKRFAEDLHDGIGPLLSGLKLYLQQETLEKGLDTKQTKVLKYCRELVDDAINQTRSIANNLTPGILNDFGLEKALASHVAKINELGKFDINLQVKESLKEIESEVSIALFRVITELLNNSLKHSQCTKVEIMCDIKKNILSVVYSDNGVGFNPQNIKSDQNQVRIGLNSIHNRIHSLNGSITFDSNPGKGVFIKIFLPVKPSEN